MRHTKNRVLQRVPHGSLPPVVVCLFRAIVICVLFAASADAQGLLWAKGAGGTGSDDGFAVAADNAGNTYSAGIFFGSGIFGKGEPNQIILSPDGGFLAKYGPTGALIWAKRIPGRPFGLALDGNGNSHLVGDFSGSQTFGAGGPNQVVLNSAGGGDIFIAKYDASGTLVWAKRAGNTVDDQGIGIALDTAGNSYITGSFGGTAGGAAVFGQGEANQTSLTSASIARDIFVAKYNTSGLLQWAKRAGSTQFDGGNGIAVDNTGDAYVAGAIFGSANFGPGEANQTILAGDASGDIFIAKYNGANGTLLWAKRAGSTGADSGVNVGVDSLGNAYLTGVFSGTATFDAIPVTSAGFSDFFIAKYNSSGAAQWVKRGGGTASENGGRVAVNGAGNIYATGTFFGSATFGQGDPNQTTINSAGGTDAFIVKYDSNGVLQWAVRAGGTGNDFGNGVAVDIAEKVHVTGQFEGTATFGQSPLPTVTSEGGWDVFVAKFSGGTILLDIDNNSLADVLQLTVPGDTILVRGSGSGAGSAPLRGNQSQAGLQLAAINDSILIRNEKQRITIDGSGAGPGTRATINGNSSSPVFNVRGKGILIQNFHIVGGNHGIHVNRGSNAVLNNNIIESSNGNGILVDELAFAVLTNNTIQNHPGAGVFVGETSTVRIGFNSDGDAAATPNTITSNGVGVIVSNGSSARIIGNTIQNNAGNGIQVSRDSSADIASNGINGNGGDGIKVESNSLVQLGEDSGTSIFESPNTTTSANTGFGIRCDDGSVVDGRQGTLTGNGGVTDFDSNCINGLIP